MKLLLAFLTVSGLAIGLLVGLVGRRRAPLPSGLRALLLVLLCGVAVALGWVLISTNDFIPVLPTEAPP